MKRTECQAPLRRVSPGRELLPAGAVMWVPAARLRWPEVRYSARGSCKPNSVVCGHSSRRRVAADVHQRPTRRFRTLRGASLRRRAGTVHESRSELTLPSLFGLAPCGVYPASDVTAGAVRSCRTISPLPRHRASMLAQGRPQPRGRGLAEAVSFLWH